MEDTDHVEIALQTPPFEAVASSLRHCITAAPGNVLVAGDFSQIEARIVLALAGQHDKVALFASGAPVYADMAAAIYGYPVTKHGNPVEYVIGKNTVLGCGFGMGPDKFFDKYCPQQSLEFAQKVVSTYREKWAPEVYRLWKRLDTMATVALGAPTGMVKYPQYKPGELGLTFKAYPSNKELEGKPLLQPRKLMTVTLPSGRDLYFQKPWCHEDPSRDGQNRRLYWLERSARVDGVPHTIERFRPDGSERPPMISYPWDFFNVRRRKEVHGGHLTENIVQGMARDILAAAMLNCKERGYIPVLHVHDEIVLEVPEHMGQSAARDLKEIMCDAPDWAKELKIPIAAEFWTGKRYKK